MLFNTASAAALALALTPSALAWNWGTSGEWTGTQRMTCHGGSSYINYTTVAGFFQQDDEDTVASTFDYVRSSISLASYILLGPFTNGSADHVELRTP